MKSIIQFKAITPALVIITVTLLCLAAAGPRVQAVTPPPDGGYSGGNTAEGQNALLSRTTGGFNTAVGWFSLKSLTTGSYNTGVGAGTLVLNSGDENTATGVGALLLNATGSQNTANGALALFNNTEGSGNTANGVQALFNNTIGTGNTAIGVEALKDNTDGVDNTATGFRALMGNTGVDNTANGSVALQSNTTGAANTATHFVYDIDFYLETPQYAFALEFDVNQTVNSRRFVFGTQRVSLSVHAGGRSAVLVRIPYDSEWHASVDGRATAILHGDYVDMAVVVPRGSHTVEFGYDDPRIGEGLIGSAAVLAALAAAALFARRRNAVTAG